jgi:hypothetical protein
MYKVITNLKYSGTTYKPDALVDLPEEIGKGLVTDGVVSLIKEKPEKIEKTDKPKKVKSVETSKKRKY